MPNIRLVIEYDGSRFHGWQVQPQVRTVQGEMHRLIEMITREKVAVLHSSGRTDAGVHARGQVVSFQLQKTPDLEVLRHSISSILRDEVAVLSAEVVPEDFHARRSAKSKSYAYSILNRAAPAVLDRHTAWYVPFKLDWELMQNEANLLLGQHDFSAFKAKDCGANSSIKTIYSASFEKEGSLMVFRIEGSGFLKNMVRIITGTLVDIGRGYKKPGLMKYLLECGDRAHAGVTAPSQGLCLEWVKY